MNRCTSIATFLGAIANAHARISVALFLAAATASTVTHAAEPLTLPAIMQLAEQHNPGLQASRDQVDVARGTRRTAQAYPNPELDIGTGPSRVRQVRGQTGQNRIIGLSQPIDYPQTRAVRIQGAEAGIDVAEAGLQGARIHLLTQVKSAFYDVLRRQDEMRIAQENFDLLGDVRDRVRLRVTIGESPRYELVKAEAELLEGAKNLESAVIRVDQAKGALRNLIGSALPENFEVTGKLQTDTLIPPLEELRREVMARSPDIAQSQARENQAAARLQLERRLRIPQVTVHGVYEEDPDIRSWRLGLSLPLPLWNRREGPIAEATAQLVQSQSLVAQQQLVLLRELETVYNNYLISSRQVDAFEAGLLREAEAALKVAEAAYRFGERGILDYLDALRVYRSVRQDFLAARFDVQAAIVQIERLRATDLSREQNQ